MMESKTKYNIEQTTTDRLVEIAGWIILAFLWLITVFYFRKLPDTIPTHFNALGTADGYGPRSAIFMPPAIGTVLFIGLTIINRYPQIFNYPVKITAENMLRQYTMATRLIRVLKLSILIIFLMIALMSSLAAINQTNKLGFWFIPLVMAMVLVPLGNYIYKSFKAK